MATTAPCTDLGADVARFRDTCNVYVLRSGRDAVLVDVGSGAALDHLADLGVDRVTDVLVTHAHRDQVQGLGRAVEAGARVWVPPYERELVADADRRWQDRQLDIDYSLREDRFSVLDPVAVTGAVDEYRTRSYGGVDVHALPTPGHTVGSVTYLVEAGGRRLAFTGDLLYAPGKVWSLAATQWSYSGVEGQIATFVSCGVLAGREPDLLLPSHGEPIDDPPAALALTRERIRELATMRLETEWDLEDWQQNAWAPITPHLARDRTSFATSYALLSESGAALLVDWGYHVATGLTPLTDRTARRPLLASIDTLRRQHGVDRVEAVVTTHYHDDHVAGLNLIREVEGAEVWSPEHVAPILEDPERYDLPCLWPQPIRVDRRLALDEPVAWREYELTPYALPGHTRYAAAIAFEVDGKRVLATGDQQGTGQQDGPDVLNYQYRNRFAIDDYVRSAELYRRLRPDLIVSGHWLPREVTDAYLDRLAEDGRRVAELHRELLPEEGFGAEGFGARIEPYRSTAARGDDVELEVLVRNPFDRDETAAVALVLPAGWEAEPVEQEVELGPHGEATVAFRVRLGGEPVRRARVAAELTVGGTPFGQQAEALVDVR